LALGGLVVVLGLTLAAMLPRTLAYDGLLEENLALRARVQTLDARIGEVDRILVRLRMYDAQMQGLSSEPSGDHGMLENGGDAGPEGDLAGSFDEFEGEEAPLRGGDDWADAVMERAETFLAVFADAEPDLSTHMSDLQSVAALQEALPAAWPATGLLSSPYGYRRSPWNNRWVFHKGIDIANRRGSPVRAVSRGRVTRAEYHEGYGRLVEIEHGFGVVTRYAHLQRYVVTEGDDVEQGELIGIMGRTGASTGIHLHFELLIDGHAVDPAEYLPR
jgi:murein DD-endopeptidase MepM/ murein hydrolase activator NlpD